VRIDCLHGYFTFHETRVGEASRMRSIFKIELTQLADLFQSGIYTFKGLEAAPNYSIEGGQYMGNDAIKTIEGKPWQVFESNGLVYDFTQKRVLPASEVSVNVKIQQSGYYYISNGLIIPGSRADQGQVLDYTAWVVWETFSFRYSWVRYG